MAKKTLVQITKDNIKQFDIKVGTILKDNEGMFWKITDDGDFTAGMRVCDKDGNETENFVGNAGRSVFGGGLSDLLNDGVTTYFIETKQPEIKKDVRYNYFVKDTAEFEQFADFEPITNLTAEEAISKFYELQKKGFNSGIGINIPNDILFDDPKGIGSTIVVIDEEKKANFSIFGDSFINNVNIETKSDTLKTRISAYEELYNKLIEQNIPTEYPQFVFEKKAELEKKLESQNYTMHDETVSTSEIEEEKLSIKKTIQQLKDELNNPDANNPADDQYISETKEYIERLENMTDEDFKNIAAEKKEQQKKNEETHRRVVERMAAEKLSREIPQEGELLSYNETHPTYSVVNKETDRQTSIQPRGRLEENVRRLARLSTLAEARNAIERIESSGFEILSTESRVVIFNEDKFYDFDSLPSYFNYTTNKFEYNSDARALNGWDFKDYIKGGLKITKRMKAFEKIGAPKENVNKNIEIITSVQGFANLKFSEKPTEEIRNILRENGWYYSRNNNVWYPSVKSKQRTAELSNQFAEDLISQFGEKPLEEQLDKHIEQMAANGGMTEETISMLAEEDEIQRAELYEEEMQDKAESEEEHSEINVDELKARISDWSSEETFEEAEGLSKQEIFEKYGTEKLPIATIPNNFLQLFENGKIKIQDNYVYSSKGFFIDHMVNHHPELDTQDYLAMQDIINNPENVYRDNVTGNIVFSQIKNNKNDVVVLGTDNDKLILYRSCFLRRKMPHKYEEIDLQKIKEMSLEGSLSSSIEPSENQKSAVAFSALNDNSNISQLKNLSNNAQSTIKLSGNNIEIPVEDAEQIENSKEWDVRDEISEYLEPDHSVSGQQILETMQMIAEEEEAEIEENFAYKNQENEETENYITEDELEAFKEIVPLAQYVATLDLMTNSEEKEFFIHKVKEIVKNVEAAPKMGKTDGEKEHPLVLKYFHPTGTQALVCEIGKHGEAYGYQILNGDHQMAEWGYINLNEFKNIPGMEIDYHIDEGMSIERYLYSENPKEYPQYAELAGNENNEPSVESFNQAEIAKQENFKSIREYEKNHENNTAQNLTESETRRNIMEESLQENDVLEEQNYGRTGENFSNGTGNLRTEHQILSGSEGKDTGRPYNEGSGSHDMAQFNDTKEASMGRDSGLERSTSGSDSLPMDGTSASDEQGNGSGQSEAVSADLSNSNGQISKDIKPDDSTGSNSTGRGNLQAAELEEELRTAHGSTEQLRNGTFVSELTKKEMKDVRSEVKKILENKKKGEEWTSSELALARLYEGGGGLKEKDATSNEILNAYYTPYKIIDAVWKLADSYAPNAVTVLEPSSGIGRFADNRLHNEFTLRELDEISSKLAKVLHPDATVIPGAFQAQFFDETGRVKKENYELPKYAL